MRVSIVTPVYNSRRTVAQAIDSILAQTYDDIELVVVDGASTDGTREILATYGNQIDWLLSEPDSGIYDAMNKGVRRCTGDIVGILGSDDYYAHFEVIRRVVTIFSRDDPDCVYGDLIYVDPNDTSRLLRYWRAGQYWRRKFLFGWMPPHPTVFLKRELYEEYGLFNENLTNSADYELVFRMLYHHGCTACYVPEVLVHMRSGGHSNATIRHRLRAHFQDYLSWYINGHVPNPLTLTLKLMRKMPQYFPGPQLYRYLVHPSAASKGDFI